MTIRKPNRVTTPRRDALNGTKTSHSSMPRARGRWQADLTRNQASTPGREELTCTPEDDAPGSSGREGRAGPKTRKWMAMVVSDQAWDGQSCETCGSHDRAVRCATCGGRCPSQWHHSSGTAKQEPQANPGPPRARQQHTGLAGEVAAGDVVSTGEAAGRPAGWVPVTGSLHEVRTSEHGTHPLPGPAGLPGTGTPAAQAPAISPDKEPGA